MYMISGQCLTNCCTLAG